MSNTDEFVVVGTKEKLISLIKIATGDVLFKIEEHTDAVTALALSRDDDILISGNFLFYSFFLYV